MARTSKIDFFHHLDIGVPMDIPRGGDSDVLLVYGSKKSLPPRYQVAANRNPGTIPAIDMQHAVQNCDYVNVVLTDHNFARNQCVALVPQYESYHIQKWMRASEKGLDRTQKLKMVSRGFQSNGRNMFDLPKKIHMKQNWDMLSTYFQAFPAVMEEL
jgi:hypothetical protein